MPRLLVQQPPHAPASVTFKWDDASKARIDFRKHDRMPEAIPVLRDPYAVTTEDVEPDEDGGDS